jgi:lipopolysaccharide export system protein LptA
MTNPRACNKRPLRNASLIQVLLGCLLWSSAAMALPEDASQPIDVDAESYEGLLDEGLSIFHGTAENPATITQGTMVISGTEIRIERHEGVLQKVTATGTPARYQQQPAADQELVHASGLSLVFDNAAQLLTIDEQAELIQAGDTFNSHHIEYDMQARRVNASGSPDGERVRLTIPPRPPGQ